MSRDHRAIGTSDTHSLFHITENNLLISGYFALAVLVVLGLAGFVQLSCHIFLRCIRSSHCRAAVIHHHRRSSLGDSEFHTRAAGIVSLAGDGHVCGTGINVVGVCHAIIRIRQHNSTVLYGDGRRDGATSKFLLADILHGRLADGLGHDGEVASCRCSSIVRTLRHGRLHCVGARIGGNDVSIGLISCIGSLILIGHIGIAQIAGDSGCLGCIAVRPAAQRHGHTRKCRLGDGEGRGAADNVVTTGSVTHGHGGRAHIGVVGVRHGILTGRNDSRTVLHCHRGPERSASIGIAGLGKRDCCVGDGLGCNSEGSGCCCRLVVRALRHGRLHCVGTRIGGNRAGVGAGVIGFVLVCDIAAAQIAGDGGCLGGIAVRPAFQRHGHTGKCRLGDGEGGGAADNVVAAILILHRHSCLTCISIVAIRHSVLTGRNDSRTILHCHSRRHNSLARVSVGSRFNAHSGGNRLGCNGHSKALLGGVAVGGVVALDLVVYGVAAGVGGLGQFRIVRTAIQLILQRAADDAAAGIDQHLLRAIEGQAGLGGGCSCDRCGRQIYNRKMQRTGDDTGVVAVCGIGVSDVTRVTQLQRLQLFHDSVITGRAIIAVSQRSLHITEGRCIKGALVHHDLNVGRIALVSHIFLLNGKGLAHGVGVIALTGQGHGGCASIKVILVLHCIVRVFGQRSLAIFHCQFRNNGAAGIRLGSDIPYHAGGQSLGGDVELCLNRPRVVALTGHDHFGRTHIGVVLIGHRVIGSSGQGLLPDIHSNSRLDGAAGVGLGRDRLYHIGGQSLGGDVELCLNRPRVVALTGHDHFGRTHIGVVLIGHRVIGSSGQGLLPDIHSNSRLDGAAGVGPGRDRLYHIGSQSLGIHGNFLLGYLGDITLGIGDRDLFVIYSQERSRGKLEVGGLHIFSAAIIVRSSDHHSRLVELLTRGISRMRAGLNGNTGQGLLGRGGEGLGQREMRRIGYDNFVALSRGCVVQGLGKTLAGFRRQGDLGSVDLIGCRRAGHGRAGGGVALVPIHCAGVAAAQGGKRGERRALCGVIQRERNAGDGRLGDGDGSGCNTTSSRRGVFFISTLIGD